MRLKSYFAHSVEEAVSQARAELGEEAMLVSSRLTERELRQLGHYEVVFGVAPAGAAVAHQTPVPAADAVLRELTELRRQMDELRESMTRSAVTRATEQLTPELARVYQRLASAGFSAELAQELTEAVAGRARPHTERGHRMIRDQQDLFARDLVNAMLEEEVASRFEVAATLGAEGEKCANVLLVGPPGAGKTTSLIKLGLRFGVRAKRSLHLVSLDTLRIGGWDVLGRFARIGSIDFRPLQDWTTLGEHLEKQANGLTLIDSPGFSKGEEGELSELAQEVRRLPVEVHLVIPASLSLEAAERTWKRFAAFEASKLIVTHRDAVKGNAAVIELAMRSGLPVSFVSDGQQIPEDLRTAVKQELMAEVWPQERTISVAA